MNQMKGDFEYMPGMTMLILLICLITALVPGCQIDPVPLKAVKTVFGQSGKCLGCFPCCLMISVLVNFVSRARTML